METRTVNLRDLPEELVRRAKACAALHGMTLKDFMVQAVERAVQQDIPARSVVSALARQARAPKRRGKSKK